SDVSVMRSSLQEKATSIPGGGAPPASRSARRAARYLLRRARRRARLSARAFAAESGSWPARIPASRISCRVAMLVVEVVVGGPPLVHVLALVRGEAVVERLQADAEHVGGL